MNKLKWSLFAEVYGRMEAELVESFFKANGIDVELIQEAYEHLAYPNTMSRVQIFVPNEMLEEAKKLYADSGWDFEITEESEEEPDEGQESE